MKKEDIILIVDKDPKHIELIRKNLLRAGLYNKILPFADGQEILDFLFDMYERSSEEQNSRDYILLLDLDLPKVDGAEVLARIKQDTQLKRIPVFILTAADDQHTIDRCHHLGCSSFVIKPGENRDFEKTIQKIGHFLSVVEITSIK